MPEDKPQENSTITLTLTAMAHGGQALGREGGRTVFVPYSIPGETVTAQIVQDKGRVAFARGVALVEASADRVFPICDHFGPGRCWGCQWQHIDSSVQPLIKQDVLADQLARVGGFEDADVRDIVPAPQPWGYAHAMTFYPLAQGGFGLPTADGDLTPVEMCHILHPALLDLYQRVTLEQDAVRAITLRLGSQPDDLMLILHVDNEEDVPELSADLAASVNLLLPDDEPLNLIGASHTSVRVQAHDFRITAGTAVRPNLAALPALVDRVVQALALDGGSVLDLYGGFGLFSAFIAPHAAVVTLVEAYPPAATDAEANLTAFDNVDIIEAEAADVLDQLDQAETRYAAALLDCPAAGLDLDVIDALGAGDIGRLVLIGADAAVLARDLKRLAAKGYQPGPVWPFDLHPQTYQVDAVAVLTR